MVLDNFKVIRLDDRNLTFEEYKTVKTKDDTYVDKWVRVGGYYGNMTQCLEGLKNYIINTYAALFNYQDVLDKIDVLNGAIVKCKIEVQG